MKDTPVQMYQFDVMRAIAIISVFFVHAQYTVFPNFDFTYGEYFINLPSKYEGYKYLSMTPFAFGGTGVLLFFLISGFLIHYTTLKKGIDNFKLGSYFNKRFWRIYPLYIIALLIFGFSCHGFSEVIRHPQDLLLHIFLVHNFSEKYIFSINGAFWSLAAEAQMYLLYPFFLYLSLKIGIKKVIQLLFLLGVVVTIYWWQSSSFEGLVIGNSTFKHWFVWGLGAYLGECFFYQKQLFRKIPIWLLVTFFIVFYFSRLLYIHKAFAHYFITILFAISMEKYLYRNKKITLFEKLLIPVGLCSYSIYLFHMPLLKGLYWGLDLFNLSVSNKALFFIVNCVPVFLIIFFISYASYIFLETRSIEFGRLFFEKYFPKQKNKKA